MPLLYLGECSLGGVSPPPPEDLGGGPCVSATSFVCVGSQEIDLFRPSHPLACLSGVGPGGAGPSSLSNEDDEEEEPEEE